MDTPVLLASGAATDLSNSTAETPVVYPSANRQLLLAIVGYQLFSPPGTPSVTGCGVTWTQVETIAWVLGGLNGRITIFRAMGQPVGGKLAIAKGNNDGNSEYYSLTEVPLALAPPGGNAVVQDEEASGTGTNAAITLLANSSTRNGVVAFWGSMNAGTVTFSPGGGYTELHDTAFTVNLQFMVQWRANNDTSVDATISGSSEWAGIAVEINAGETPAKGGVPLHRPVSRMVRPLSVPMRRF